MTPIKEWAERYRLGLTTVYRMLNRGDLTAVKIGKLTFINDDADRAFRESLPKYQPQNGGQE